MFWHSLLDSLIQFPFFCNTSLHSSHTCSSSHWIIFNSAAEGLVSVKYTGGLTYSHEPHPICIACNAARLEIQCAGCIMHASMQAAVEFIDQVLE
jgi:hypothetical protein